MNLRLIFLIFLLALPLQSTQAEEETTVNRPKIGLVLSGGGAKGFAHIGTLKMLDSLKIPVDYIAGTSMGAIAGALYAIGYNGLDIEKLTSRKDWEEIFTDLPPRPELPYFLKEETGKYQLTFGLRGFKPTTPSGLIFGQKISLLFTSLTFPYERVTDFDRLPIPFRCVAVDLVSGNEVVLKGGSLAKAMRASMSIPTVFSPVEWGDSLLVDGGLVNNLPVDVVKAMGADIVIAVDVQSPLLKREKLSTALSTLEQTVTLVGLDRCRENAALADILIVPDIAAFSAADFDNDKVRRIIQRGNLAARQSRPRLVALKEKYRLLCIKDTSAGDICSRSPRIYDIQIASHTSIPFESIYNRLKLTPDDTLNIPQLEARISEMRTSGDFETLSYETIPISNEYVRLIIRAREKQKPLIKGIAITGNQTLPFSFIYRLLGLKPGNRLDTEDLNHRITEMYGLGYFERIYYEIEPVEQDYVRLTLIVKELPIRKLRVGLRYDDRYKLVAAISAQATNLLIPGLRLENEFQFAGLQRFQAKAYYPSRALRLPIYPFLRLEYKDIPTHIFDDLGHRIAEYRDRSTAVGMGLGLLFAKSVNTEVEFQQEYMDIKPNVALPDPTMFPSWKDRLRQVRARMCIDRLDDVLLPRTGILFKARYEGSSKKLNSDLRYHQICASMDWYQTFHRRHTIRLHAFSGKSYVNLPIYKFFNQGRPESFVGMNYDQLFVSGLSIARIDYRFEHKKDIFLKLIVNRAFDIEYHNPPTNFRLHELWGFGTGIIFLSPIGPIEIIVSRCNKDYAGSGAMRTRVYFTFGYKF
jgi:predicted acylesterase/phospholipase RssA